MYDIVQDAHTKKFRADKVVVRDKYEMEKKKERKEEKKPFY